MARKIFFTPGPSQLYFTAEEHLKRGLSEQIPSISHRSSQFQSIFQEARSNLRELLDIPEHFDIFFLASATEAWERIIQNLVQHTSHHIFNGSFGKRFFEIADAYGIDATKTEAAPGQPFDDIDIPGESEVISITQNETSVGFFFPEDRISDIRKNHPQAIIALDVVSSVPVAPIPFDTIDTAYFSVQKSFGLPAGLGVWIVNDRCVARAEQLLSQDQVIGSYHSLPSLKKTGDKNQTPETPNVLDIYLLANVARDMNIKGIDVIRREAKYKSTLTYQLYQENDHLEPFVGQQEFRSPTVMVGKTNSRAKELIQFIGEKGLVIGSGYGPFKKDHIRIANFPTHSKEQFELLIDLISTFNS